MAEKIIDHKFIALERNDEIHDWCVYEVISAMMNAPTYDPIYCGKTKKEHDDGR